MESAREPALILSSERAVLPLERSAQKRKQKTSLSYVAVIAHAILSSPRQRLALSEIYQFIEEQHPEFTENRARWKNTVRHNLSLHDCFVRGEVALNKKGCNWRIHPSFIAEYSRGDFSRHKLSQRYSLPLEIRYETSPHGSQHPVTPTSSCNCFMCASSQRFLPSPALLQYPRRGFQYMQPPQVPWHLWTYWTTSLKNSTRGGELIWHFNACPKQIRTLLQTMSSKYPPCIYLS